MTRAPLPQVAAEYLQDHHVMTVATHGPDGPWAAAVFYAMDGAGLVFVSSPTSRHGRHLAQDPRCAATIQDAPVDWAQIRGVQLEGMATQLHGEEQARAQRLYAARFPLVAAGGGAPAAIVAALARVRWYRLDAERLYFIDNSRGFGHRDEIVPRAG